MKREQIIRIIEKVPSAQPIKNAYPFGSFARDEKYRDIDTSVNPCKGKFSLLNTVSVKQKMEDKTEKGIDLVLINSINSRLKTYIKKDIKTYLEKLQ